MQPLVPGEQQDRIEIHAFRLQDPFRWLWMCSRLCLLHQGLRELAQAVGMAVLCHAYPGTR